MNFLLTTIFQSFWRGWFTVLLLLSGVPFSPCFFNPLALRALPLSHLPWAEGEETWICHLHGRYFLTPPALRATSPIFCVAKHPVMLLGTAGEEFQIPTPKRYVIICCSKYRYSHFSKNKGGMWNVLWCCEGRGRGLKVSLWTAFYLFGTLRVFSFSLVLRSE